MARRFSLKWSNHSSILNSFRTYLSTERMTDVTIICDGGKELKAHKLVLSACSSVFQSMLTENEQQNPVIFLCGIRYDEFKAILDFIYGGESIIPADRLEGVLQCAETFRVQILGEVLKEREEFAKQSERETSNSCRQSEKPPKDQKSPANQSEEEISNSCRQSLNPLEDKKSPANQSELVISHFYGQSENPPEVKKSPANQSEEKISNFYGQSENLPEVKKSLANQSEEEISNSCRQSLNPLEDKKSSAIKSELEISNFYGQSENSPEVKKSLANQSEEEISNSCRQSINPLEDEKSHQSHVTSDAASTASPSQLYNTNPVNKLLEELQIKEHTPEAVVMLEDFDDMPLSLVGRLLTGDNRRKESSSKKKQSKETKGSKKHYVSFGDYLVKKSRSQRKRHHSRPHCDLLIAEEPDQSNSCAQKSLDQSANQVSSSLLPVATTKKSQTVLCQKMDLKTEDCSSTLPASPSKDLGGKEKKKKIKKQP